METFSETLQKNNINTISIGGNCIANMFATIKSPFAGVNFENGILNLYDLFNNYFYECTFTKERMHQRPQSFVVDGFEFLHLDISKPENIRKVQERYESTFLKNIYSEDVLFIYSLSYYDSKYVTEEFLEGICRIIFSHISNEKIIIIESENSQLNNGENGHFQNYRNPAFYKYFKNVIRVDFSKDPYLQVLPILQACRDL